ncbi:MAG: PhoH family protein [Thermotogae bacterium]|nr:PhoH family protein [Thermotogota bacterium]MCP5465480.1 PhoH family protein [Thermotogota bacterium]
MVKNYVIDTNTLIHDPESIFKFEDNNVIIPFPVIEEIDKLKTRQDRISKEAREVNRILDSLRSRGSLSKGVALENGGKIRIVSLDKKIYNEKIPNVLGDSMDDYILRYALYLSGISEERTIIVSKDLNLRIKADALNLESQDYMHDKVDIKSLFKGFYKIEKSSLEYKTEYSPDELGVNPTDLFPNCYFEINDKFYRYTSDKIKLIGSDYNIDIFGISPRNPEQVFAVNALLDKDIPLVTLVGTAGTGKTLLAVASGLEMIFSQKAYKKMLVSKPVIPMGKDIGYIPGSIEEKMRPWIQPVYDNLEFLFEGKGKKPEDFLSKKDVLEIEVLSYIRGRSIPNQLMIIDEAQNLTPAEIKTILTRVGEGTKIILTGDPDQIDNPYLDASSNGLVYVANKFRDSAVSAHITLSQGERSELSSLAAKLL